MHILQSHRLSRPKHCSALSLPVGRPNLSTECVISTAAVAQGACGGAPAACLRCCEE